MPKMLNKNTKIAIATLFNFDLNIDLSVALRVCRNSAGFVFDPRLCEERTVEPYEVLVANYKANPPRCEDVGAIIYPMVDQWVTSD